MGKNIGAVLVLALLAVASLFGACAPSVSPIDVESIRKGYEVVAPQVFIEGRAARDQVAAWTAPLRRDTPLAPLDLDGDGNDDLLAEDVGARGTTGNRAFMLFLRTGRGWRYVGSSGNIDHPIRFADSGNIYLIDHGNCGPILSYGIMLLGPQGFKSVGIQVHVENEEVAPRRERLLERLGSPDLTEEELRRLFSIEDSEVGQRAGG